MFNLYRVFFLFLIMTLSFNSFAAIKHLVTGTTDEDKNEIVLSLITDDHNDITGLEMKKIKPSGELVDKDTFKSENIHDGLVLMRVSGREVVKLVSKNFSEHNGGDVKMDCLYSGISGKRRSTHFNVERDADEWVLTYKGKVTKKIHFVSNKKMLIGSIGVKKVIVK